jgi:hypothetical protein
MTPDTIDEPSGFPSGRRQFVRSVHAPSLLGRFLVCAVTAILVIRAYLTLTGFPQIGGHGLHVAHMLFGGLGMLIALFTGLSFLGPRASVFAATVGGVGFGAFIDELGKFITGDNNYFFRPTIALIYIIFVLLVIVALRISAGGRAGPAQRLAQATAVVTGAVVEGYPASARDLAVRLLAESDPRNPLVPALRDALARIVTRPDPPPWFVTRATQRLAAAYAWLTDRPWFMWLILAVVAVASALSLGQAAVSVLTDPADHQVRLYLDTIAGFLVLVNLIAGIMLVAGLFALRRSRLDAYRWFRLAVLVSLLLAQPLAFYEQQWSALVGLVLNLVFLAALDYGIAREMALAAPMAEPAAIQSPRSAIES